MKQKIANFMYGRYGNDQLNRALSVLILLLLIVLLELFLAACICVTLCAVRNKVISFFVFCDIYICASCVNIVDLRCLLENQFIALWSFLLLSL